MLTMNEDLEGALREYLALMDAGEYFEAHEILEEAWHQLRLRKDPLANLAKGLINGAIAFEHLKRNRNKAAKRAQRVITSFERHKNICTEGIEHYTLFSEACNRVEALKIQHTEVFS